MPKPTLAASALQMRDVCLPMGCAQPFPVTPMQPMRTQRVRSRSISHALTDPCALIGHDLRTTETESGDALGNLRRICMVARIDA